MSGEADGSHMMRKVVIRRSSLPARREEGSMPTPSPPPGICYLTVQGLPSGENNGKEWAFHPNFQMFNRWGGPLFFIPEGLI